MATGTLITLSGADGSGKSTLAAELAVQARSTGRWQDVVETAPLKGDNELIARIKSLDGPAQRWEARERWLAGYYSLMLAEAADRTVRPALSCGCLVIADRWVVDHVVNQAYFGVSVADWATLFDTLPVPTLALLVDVPPAVAIARVANRLRSGVGAGEDFLTFATARFAELTAGTHLRVSGLEPPADNAADVLKRLLGADQPAAVS